MKPLRGNCSCPPYGGARRIDASTLSGCASTASTRGPATPARPRSATVSGCPRTTPGSGPTAPSTRRARRSAPPSRAAFPDEIADLLRRVQNDLFDVGADLVGARSGRRAARARAGCASATAHVAALEEACDRHSEALEPLTSFVLSGGTPAAAALHVARTTCRRAERCAVALAELDGGEPGLAGLPEPALGSPVHPRAGRERRRPRRRALAARGVDRARTRRSYSVEIIPTAIVNRVAGENPFRYGDVVSGTQFTDRRAEIAALRADVESGQNVVVIAPRRTGKSSLMRACVEELRAGGRPRRRVRPLRRAPTRAGWWSS